MSDSFAGGSTPQVDLPAASLEIVFTAPGNYTSRVTVIFCNRNAAARTIRLMLSRGGTAPADEGYLLYDLTLNGNSSEFIRDLSITQADILRAYASDLGVSVNVLVDDGRRINLNA